MEREFKEKSDKFKYRGMKFRYDQLHHIHLGWSMYGGRSISLRHELSRSVIEFRQDLSDVPISILRASVNYFKERLSKELLRNEKFRDARMSFTNYEKAKV